VPSTDTALEGALLPATATISFLPRAQVALIAFERFVVKIEDTRFAPVTATLAGAWTHRRARLGIVIRVGHGGEKPANMLGQ